jgi:ABC-2 type transport system ATP-binding protein
MLETAAGVFARGVRDDEALTLQVPSEGGVTRLREVLDGLAAAEIDVDELSLHTPDLDDVFLALTGQPTDAHPEREQVA